MVHTNIFLSEVEFVFDYRILLFFLYRIAGLIVGWFAFLFCLELVLRIFLGLVALILTSCRGSGSANCADGKNEEQVVEKKATFTVENDEIKKVKFNFDMKVGKEL